MPHFILEYSANLDADLDLDALIAEVHETAMGTGIFPLAGCRTRVARREHFKIADGHPENGFVHLTARIGMGRTLDVKQAAGQAIFDGLTAALADLRANRPIAISFEIVEIDKDLSWKQNNIADALKARSEGHAA